MRNRTRSEYGFVPPFEICLHNFSLKFSTFSSNRWSDWHHHFSPQRSQKMGKIKKSIVPQMFGGGGGGGGNLGGTLPNLSPWREGVDYRLRLQALGSGFFVPGLRGRGSYFVLGGGESKKTRHYRAKLGCIYYRAKLGRITQGQGSV